MQYRLRNLLSPVCIKREFPLRVAQLLSMSTPAYDQQSVGNPAEKVPSESPNDASLDEKLSTNGEDSHDDEEVVYEDSFDKFGHRGVPRVRAINRIFNSYGTFTLFGRQIHTLRVLLLFFLFLQGYVTGLDGNMSTTMQVALITTFGHTADTSAVTTVKSVIASAVFIPYARLSDKFGRMEIWLAALIPFLAGRIATAATPNFAGLFAGTVIEELGYAGFRFLSGVLPSDVSALKDHTFTINIYELPEIINMWAASHISQSLVGANAADYAANETEARWGYGMFAILVPFTTVLLATVYFSAQYIAYRRKELPSTPFFEKGKSVGVTLLDFFSELDLVGVILYTAGMVLLLLAFSLGGGASNEWKSAHIIVMIVVGGCLILIWIGWEYFLAKSPILPRRYFGITFASALLMEFFTRTSVSTLLGQGSYNLLIPYAQTTEHAQWLGTMVLFVGALVNLFMGIILHYWPHPKFFILTGSWIFLLGVGLFVKYRVDYFNGGIHGYIGADVIMGLGAAMMRYPLWTLVQASVPHKDMAAAIGLLMSAYQIGASVGSCLASAVWQNTIQAGLMEYVGTLGSVTYYNPTNKKNFTMPGETLAVQLSANPAKFEKILAVNPELGDAVKHAYYHGNWVTAVLAVALAALVPLLAFIPFPYDVQTSDATISEEKRKEEESKFSDGRKPFYQRLVGF